MQQQSNSGVRVFDNSEESVVIPFKIPMQQSKKLSNDFQDKGQTKKYKSELNPFD